MMFEQQSMPSAMRQDETIGGSFMLLVGLLAMRLVVQKWYVGGGSTLHALGMGRDVGPLGQIYSDWGEGFGTIRRFKGASSKLRGTRIERNDGRSSKPPMGIRKRWWESRWYFVS